jgi:hypothetical protein
LGWVADPSTEASTEAALSVSTDLEASRSDFREEIAAVSEPLGSEIQMLKRCKLIEKSRIESQIGGLPAYELGNKF